MMKYTDTTTEAKRKTEKQKNLTTFNSFFLQKNKLACFLALKLILLRRSIKKVTIEPGQKQRTIFLSSVSPL